LGGDADEQTDGSGEKSKKENKFDEAADVKALRGDFAGAEIHDENADQAEGEDGAKRHEGLGGNEARRVFQDAGDAGVKNARFGSFGVVALDDPDAAKRFGEAAGDFGGETRAFTSERTENSQDFLEEQAEGEEDADGERGHGSADAEEEDEREKSGKETASEIEKAITDEMAETFDVGHDAGGEGSGAVGVIKGNGKTGDVLLDAETELSDEFLSGGIELAAEDESDESMGESGGGDGGYEYGELLKMVSVHNVVDKVAGGDREREAAETIDE
jgi:hypothetical protein